MPHQPITYIYRRDWPDDESDYYDENDLADFGDRVVDGFFGSKEPEKKPDGKCAEPTKKAPEKNKCEPPKPEANKSCTCKAKEKKRPKKKSQSICKKIIKKAKSSSSCKKVKPKNDKCGATPRSRNPFLIFFLTMLRKQKNKRVTEVAREAGKQWCCLDPKTKEMYQKLAKEERIRRNRISKGSRKKSCKRR